MKSFHSNWPKTQKFSLKNQKFSLILKKFSLRNPNDTGTFSLFSLAFHNAEHEWLQGFEACFHQNRKKEWVPNFFSGVFHGY